MLVDFGLSMMGMSDTDTTKSLLGTIGYVAPEMAMRKAYNKSVDWYQLGILLYEMVAGFLPYSIKTKRKFFKSLIHLDIRFPKGLSIEIQDLLTKLLCKEPKNRIGYNGSQDIKKHAFFKDFSWNDI